MRVRELPGRVKKAPVVKATFLGWLGRYTPGMPGYFCVVMTHAENPETPSQDFRVYVLHAASLDKPWREHQTWTNLSVRQAAGVFGHLEGQAEWQKGGGE